MNPDLTPFQRQYSTNIKRLGELERQLRYFESICEENEVPLHQEKGKVSTFWMCDLLQRATSAAAITMLTMVYISTSCLASPPMTVAAA